MIGTISAWRPPAPSLPARGAGLAALVVIVLALGTASFLHGQTDAAGNTMTEDQLVNDSDFANRGKTTKTDNDPGTTSVTRDEDGNVTDVEVRDGKGRLRRKIKIRRIRGRTTVETTDYRWDKTRGHPTPDRSTQTVWEGEGRQSPTQRHHEIYDPNDSPPEGAEPETTESWYEQWIDGHWVRGPRSGSGPLISPLISSGALKVDIAGTGETIGHIADLRLTNTTGKPMALSIPPLVLESISGKTQHYAVPGGQEVALDPGQTKTVGVDGVCLVRGKPPVGRGVTGDLLINEGGEPTVGSPTKLPAGDVRTMLRMAQATYKAAKQLEKEGALKEIPYSDPKKKQDIVVQWSTWMNPDLAKVTGVPPATRQDLEKVVYKQVEASGPMTPQKKKKVDEGINTIFEKIELTSARAKDLEESEKEEDPAKEDPVADADR